jgi:hypothetical protein
MSLISAYNIKSFLCVLFCVVIFGFTCVVAQEPIVSVNTGEIDRSRANKAVAVLDRTLGEITNLRSAENRLTLKSAVADTLWSYDPKKARSIYDEVTAEFGNYLIDRQTRTQQGNDAEGSLSLLIQDILQSMAKHDSGMALKFLEAADAQPNPSGEQLEPQNNQIKYELELKLALQLAGREPDEAMKAARRSLANGLSYSLPDLVLKMSEHDPKIAAELVKEIEAKILEDKAALSSEAATVSIGLIRISSEVEKNQPIVTSETARRLLVRLLVTAIGTSGSSTNLLPQLESMKAEVQKFAPEYYPQLQRSIDNYNRTINIDARILNQYQSLINEGSLDELLATIPKAPTEAQATLYQQAAWKALGAGNPEQARQIVNNLVSDVVVRGQILTQIDQQILRQKIERGDVSEVRNSLSKLNTIEEKIRALVELADALAARQNKREALRLLNEARALTVGQVKNSAQFGSQIEMARAYAGLDAERSFELMERLVDQVNSMVAAGAVLDGFIGQQPTYSDGELLIRPDAGVINAIFIQCVTGLLPLARIDFDRAISTAEKFGNNETSIAARIFLVQIYLSDSSRSNP